MPDGITRVTLVALPFGLQRQFRSDSRLVPHLGFGAGPLVRFDHRGLGGGNPYMTSGANIGMSAGYPQNSLSVGIPLYLEDFPTLSLTAGGFVSSGANLRFGESRDLALTVEARYTLEHFTDALGNPGDFSGPSLSIGFGKYF